MTRVLVTGWIGVEGGEATAGDLLSAERVQGDLEGAGCVVDLATNSGLPQAQDLEAVDPSAYDVLVVVCGPLHGARLHALVDRFPHARKVAANVSVIDRSLADRFDAVIPRDSGDETHPDLTFALRPDPLPVIGVIRSHEQPEYEGGLHERAHDAIRLLLASRPCATVDFDTRVHPSADPLAAHARTPAEVTSLAARMDTVVTTRLHGLVLSLAQGTPVLAIDPISGGAKVAKQAEALDWPAVFTADDLDSERLAEPLSWCLTAEARDRARAAGEEAARQLDELRDRIQEAGSDSEEQEA